jgi:aspartyl-tRNA synthetase
MYRTHTCGELSLSHTNQIVTLAGRVHKHRDLGGMIFIDLRDRYGITQVVLDPNKVSPDAIQISHRLRAEDCIQVHGTVKARPTDMINTDMITGHIEVDIHDIKILSQSDVLPFPIAADPNTSEENRMKYRYLDLRRRSVLQNMQFRAQMTHFTRNRFTENDFLEVQTPIMTVSSPEGARDYLVPSRVNPGEFYALPQAPQQYKQLLMVGGIDKYFQIAPCFRDEDPRADRAMCEFYQIDLEMSFVEQEDVLQVLKKYSLDLVHKLTPHKTLKFGDQFPKISYYDAMDKYGIDRPDLRFDMQMINISDIVANSEFGVFKNTVAEGGVVKAMKLDSHIMTRKEIDEATDLAKQAGAGGLAYFIYEQGEIKSPIAKFFSSTELDAMTQVLEAKDGDMIFFGAGKGSLVAKVMHKIRMHCRDKYKLVNENELAFCFVIDFPFYEYDEDKDTRDFWHNPFSHVLGGVEALDSQDMSKIMTQQYDLVLNGLELGSGSIRNHNPDVLLKVFQKVGYDEAEIKKRFGAIYQALHYGCPPHGGFAFGFDRLLMILLDEPNIRECYAFPKSAKAQDVMMWAPSYIDPKLLQELHIQTIE